MKDYKQQYYIENVPWQRNLDYDKILCFENLKFSDYIVFHFDTFYAQNKVSKYNPVSNNLLIASINACLRYYQIIKKLYPYNQIRVIMHTLGKTENLEVILSMIPNFAVTQGYDNNLFTEQRYKHIYYGKLIPTNHNIQRWSCVKGNLIIS